MIDPSKLAVGRKPSPTSPERAPRHKQGEAFLRGPIPLSWLSTASNVSGQGGALKVALAIWYLSGLNQQAKTVKLQTSALRLLGVKRHSAYRGLKVLERAGLVHVIRHPGRTPVITLLEPGRDIDA